MIIVVAGPSGSGKTTLINKLITKFNFRIINVDVYSNNKIRDYSKDSGRNNVSKENFFKNKKAGHYTFINEYNGSFYGYSFPKNHCKQLFLIDYPGEYPDCIELKNEEWKGVLVLPPSKDELIARLQKADRKNRIKSSLKEYDECIDDLKNQRMKNWFVVINDSLDKIQFISNFLLKSI